MKNCAVLYALLALIPFFVPATTHASMPDYLWVVTLHDGESIDDAWAAGAVVLDRAANLLVIGDAQSAAKLERAGFVLSEPVETGGRTDLALLTGDGHGAIVPMGEEMLFDAENAGFHAKQLRTTPVRMPRARGALGPSRAKAATFHPLIDDMVAQVDSARYMRWIGDLSGEQEVMVTG